MAKEESKVLNERQVKLFLDGAFVVLLGLCMVFFFVQFSFYLKLILRRLGLL